MDGTISDRADPLRSFFFASFFSESTHPTLPRPPFLPRFWVSQALPPYEGAWGLCGAPLFWPTLSLRGEPCSFDVSPGPRARELCHPPWSFSPSGVHDRFTTLSFRPPPRFFVLGACQPTKNQPTVAGNNTSQLGPLECFFPSSLLSPQTCYTFGLFPPILTCFGQPLGPWSFSPPPAPFSFRSTNWGLCPLVNWVFPF